MTLSHKVHWRLLFNVEDKIVNQPFRKSYPDASTNHEYGSALIQMNLLRLKAVLRGFEIV